MSSHLDNVKAVAAQLRARHSGPDGDFSVHMLAVETLDLVEELGTALAELARAQPVLDALGRWRDTTEHAATEALAYAYDAYVAGPGGGAGHTRTPADPLRCPTCESPAPNLHPAVQHEGEVQICSDPWHRAGHTRAAAERELEPIHMTGDPCHCSACSGRPGVKFTITSPAAEGLSSTDTTAVERG